MGVRQLLEDVLPRRLVVALGGGSHEVGGQVPRDGKLDSELVATRHDAKGFARQARTISDLPSDVIGRRPHCQLTDVSNERGLLAVFAPLVRGVIVWRALIRQGRRTGRQWPTGSEAVLRLDEPALIGLIISF